MMSKLLEISLTCRTSARLMSDLERSSPLLFFFFFFFFVSGVPPGEPAPGWRIGSPVNVVLTGPASRTKVSCCVCFFGVNDNSK